MQKIIPQLVEKILYVREGSFDLLQSPGPILSPALVPADNKTGPKKVNTFPIIAK
jgi:hypothetical protein